MAPIKTSYTGKDFLSLPKEHHHVSRLMVLFVSLGIIISGYSGYLYLTNPSYPSFSSNDKTPETDQNIANNDDAAAVTAAIDAELLALKNETTVARTSKEADAALAALKKSSNQATPRTAAEIDAELAALKAQQ